MVKAAGALMNTFTASTDNMATDVALMQTISRRHKYLSLLGGNAPCICKCVRWFNDNLREVYIWLCKIERIEFNLNHNKKLISLAKQPKNINSVPLYYLDITNFEMWCR